MSNPNSNKVLAVKTETETNLVVRTNSTQKSTTVTKATCDVQRGKRKNENGTFIIIFFLFFCFI